MTKNFEYKMTFDSRLIKSETARKQVFYAYSVMMFCLPPDLFMDYMRQIHKLHRKYAFKLLSNVAYHFQNQDREHTLEPVGYFRAQQMQNALFRDLYRFDNECGGGFLIDLAEKLEAMDDGPKFEGCKFVIREIIDAIEAYVVED